MARRRLSDFGVLSKTEVFEDPNSTPENPLEPIEVVVVKLNRPDYEDCARKADAAKGRLLTRTRDKDSEDYQSMFVQVAADVEDKEMLANMLVLEELARKKLSFEAQLAAEDEWAKDNYLEGLREAWSDGLEDRWVEDPDEPEAARVHAELQRFADAVDERVSEEKETLIAFEASKTLEELQHAFTERIAKGVADEEWYRVFKLTRLFHAVREPDGDRKPQLLDKYFEDVREVDCSPQWVQDKLNRVYEEIEVDNVEGKESPGHPVSSTISDSTVTAET